MLPIHRRSLLTAIILTLLPPAARAGGGAAPTRPNIVLIVADDLGYGELGSYGGTQVPTPHLDALARRGVRFTDGYVTAPFCAASRAALLTGRYQTRFGFEFNPIGAENAEPGIGLPLGERTLAEVLRDAGYVTGLLGKWHLGGTARYHPTRRGFDEFFGFLHEGHYYVPPPWPGVVTWLRRKALPDGTRGRWASPDGGLVYSTHLGNNEPEYDADNPLLLNSQPVDERAYLTDALTREAVDFVARHRHQPFFLEVAYNAVHSPMQAPAPAVERFGLIEDVHRRIFAAMLAGLDEGIGKILAALRDRGLEDNTLVVFLSDNGGPTRELTSSNLPLRGEKGGLYEGGIRVPFLVSWKGRLPSGRVYDRPVSALDVFPTALAAAGVTLPAGAPSLDGVDLLPFLTDARRGRPHDRLYWRVGPKAALRLGDWKLVRDAGRRAQGEWQLFDLSSDQGERHDLADREPAKLRELEATWAALDAEMVEPLWGGGAARPHPAGARGR